MSDLISRQAAIDAFRKELCREREYATPFISLNGCERILNELPSAERRGRWVESEIENEKYVCSVCGGACWYYDREGDVAKSNFCPNCWADMEVDE